MKMIILYFLGLVLAWLGLNTLMVAVAYWGQAGAMVPFLIGGVTVLVAMWLLLGAVRRYRCLPGLRKRKHPF